MKSIRHVTGVLAVLSAALLGCGPWAGAAHGQPPKDKAEGGAPAKGGPVSPAEREVIRKKLKDAWDAIRTLEFTSEETFIFQEAGTFVEMRYEFALGEGDKRALAITFIGKDGEQAAPSNRMDTRSDGRTRYMTHSVPGRPDQINQVVISDKIDPRDHYKGVMGGALWLWTPGGRPLHAHLDAGGTLEVVRTKGEPDRFVLVAPGRRGSTIRCELDPDHDWLPSRVVVPGVLTDEVTRWKQDNGRWFPAAGHHLDAQAVAGRNASTDFEVTRLKINRPIPASTFEPLPFPEKAFVVDERGNEK